MDTISVFSTIFILVLAGADTYISITSDDEKERNKFNLGVIWALFAVLLMFISIGK